jgi:23S rRNA (adenine2503-C2)-methyltransferase
MRYINELDPTELSEFISSCGQPPYRLHQIYQWLYKEGIDSFEKMLNLPKSFREKLKDHFFISFPRVAEVLTSEDGTQKFLFSLKDGVMIETVIIRDKGRLTLCLSTQAGCRQGCRFCLTGKMEFYRSLRHHEISDQVLAISNLLRPKKITHLVLMGMGEPLDNYVQTIRAAKTLIDPERGSFHPRRITLSTVGVVPGIYKLGKEKLGIKLAVSLNAPTDKIRNALMPVNRTYPLSDLVECLRNYPLPPGQKITIEYCLIRGLNDSQNCAASLASLLQCLKGRVKVNLIPYNENPVLPFQSSTMESLDRFQTCLVKKGILAFIRKSKGREILAACGQLGYQSNEN